ncbi:MAG TPA: SRPBCC family protein, partial [Gemmatimonadales bacterium]|nr:SRPBCC family protein [Gemmatimonadales bacterium]
TTWQHSVEHQSTASPETLWRYFADVPGWPRWNAGIERITIDGPFAAGTEFLMTPPGMETLRSRLVDVRENDRFVDETRLGDIVVRVEHRLEQTAGGGTRIVYAIAVQGPDAAAIGPAISADFPDVMRALARLAESENG